MARDVQYMVDDDGGVRVRADDPGDGANHGSAVHLIATVSGSNRGVAPRGTTAIGIDGLRSDPGHFASADQHIHQPERVRVDVPV